MAVLQELKKIKWEPIFTREGFPYFISHLSFEGFTKDMKKYIGWGYKDQLIISKKNILSVYGSQRDIESFKRFTATKGIKFFLGANNLILDKLSVAKKGINEIGKKLSKRKLDSEELISIINLFYKSYRELYSVYRFSTLFDQYYEGKFKNKVINKFATTKDLCGKFFTKTDSTTLEIIKNRLSQILKIDKNTILYLNYQELISLLKGDKVNVELKSRYNYYVMLAVKSQINLFVGKDIKKIISNLNFLQDNNRGVDIIHGSAAFKGKAKGRVRVVYLLKELETIKKDTILVTPMTTINFTPFLKKFSAIVTDEGGVTCHAAIVSRELNIPCVIGTKIATKVLKDGDKVEVDANLGIVKKI